MRRLFIASVALAALTASPVLAQDDPMPASIESAVADETRPEADRQLDANRHPAEVLLFAGLEPGWRVADLAAGSGYYSRVLSTAVGSDGHVYTMNPTWVAERFAETDAGLAAFAGAPMAGPHHALLQIPIKRRGAAGLSRHLHAGEFDRRDLVPG